MNGSIGSKSHNYVFDIIKIVNNKLKYIIIIMTNRDILVIFDIDETILQFINKKAYHFWQETTDEQKKMIADLEYIDNPKKEQIIFFRPKIKDFLKLVKSNSRIKIALWTYSEREYAEDIANLISNHFDIPKDTFVFTYGSEDIDDDIPKSLMTIWENPQYKNRFNKFNTFLLDDRLGNLCHKINKENSILVQAFAPFGETKAREKTTDLLLQKAIKDPMFEILIEIINNILIDIDGCSDKEIKDACNIESVFAVKNLKRKKIDKYLKDFTLESNYRCSLITIGDVANASSIHKGGKTKKRKTKKRKTKKRKTKKRKTKKRKSKKYNYKRLK